MSYIYEHPIMHYVREERGRCAALAKALVQDAELLMFCINNTYNVTEIDTARKRLIELQPVDEFEDLM